MGFEIVCRVQLVQVVSYRFEGRVEREDVGRDRETTVEVGRSTSPGFMRSLATGERECGCRLSSRLE